MPHRNLNSSNSNKDLALMNLSRYDAPKNCFCTLKKSSSTRFGGRIHLFLCRSCFLDLKIEYLHSVLTGLQENTDVVERDDKTILKGKLHNYLPTIKYTEQNALITQKTANKGIIVNQSLPKTDAAEHLDELSSQKWGNLNSLVALNPR
ncbi:hypothetical protein BY996DRAFT_6449628 [Phakopsora pachyrhizi]|nr:hypothetical protein BY996DRAFT_6449628 [Phakopsora pachyrhizi]